MKTETLVGDSGSISVDSIQYLFGIWEIIKSDPENWYGNAVVSNYHPSSERINKRDLRGKGTFRTSDGKAYCGDIEIRNFREEQNKIGFHGLSVLSDCTPEISKR